MGQTRSKLSNYLNVYKKSLGKRFYIISTLAIMSGLAESFGILMVLPLLNSIGGEKGSVEGQSELTNFIGGLDLTASEILIGIIIAFLLKGVLLYLALSINAGIRAELLKEYKEKLVSLVSEMSYRYFVSKDSGYFINIINEQVNRALQAFHHLTQVIVQVITAFIYIALAFIIAWRFGLMALVMGLVLSFVFKSINNYVRELSRNSASENGRLTKLLIQHLGGFEYLVTTNQGGKSKSEINSAIGLLSGLQKKTWVAAALTQSVREPLAVLFIMFIVLLQVSFFNEPVSPIIVSIILFYRAMNSLLAMQTQWQFALEFIGSTELINEEKKRLIKKKEIFGEKEVSGFQNEIFLNAVNFGYQKNHKLINNLSLSIQKNQTVAFVGPSGAGKSTLIKLISGVVIPDGGSISVDGLSLNEVNIESWRNQIGYVPQSPVLFDDTILNNISMDFSGDCSSQEDILLRVKNACEAAHIAEYIETLDQGYFTNVGERGVNLSGGQKQRLCIARELYRNTSVLMLDEATSALDSQSEKLIQQSLDELNGRVTLIIVAHRLSTIKNVDKIFVIDQGSVIEEGSFDELMLADGSKFAQLVRTQKL